MFSDAPWPAPAKLNLMLRITGRREDGYHELQSVFQFVDYGDDVYLAIREDGQIVRHSELPGVPAAQDMVVRAAQLLQAETGCPHGADIRVDKRLPMGGGLGGGSSDAATVLVGLNHLWNTGLDEDALASLGLSLGADVPVFVRGHAAWAEGVGERLTPVDLPEPWYLVVKPPCEVATAEIFQAPELTRNSPLSTIRDFLAGLTANDCLPVVEKRYPEVAQARAWLGQFGEARLTGTGSCIFAVFEEADRAREALSAMPAGYQGFVARGLNGSPLLERLNSESGRAR
jgi:4-diphosphocytidyl-2-C-methyl-D-erythritol kinase